MTIGGGSRVCRLSYRVVVSRAKASYRRQDTTPTVGVGGVDKLKGLVQVATKYHGSWTLWEKKR